MKLLPSESPNLQHQTLRTANPSVESANLHVGQATLSQAVHVGAGDMAQFTNAAYVTPNFGRATAARVSILCQTEHVLWHMPGQSVGKFQGNNQQLKLSPV